MKKRITKNTILKGTLATALFLVPVMLTAPSAFAATAHTVPINFEVGLNTQSKTISVVGQAPSGTTATISESKDGTQITQSNMLIMNDEILDGEMQNLGDGTYTFTITPTESGVNLAPTKMTTTINGGKIALTGMNVQTVSPNHTTINISAQSAIPGAKVSMFVLDRDGNILKSYDLAPTPISTQHLLPTIPKYSVQIPVPSVGGTYTYRVYVLNANGGEVAYQDQQMLTLTPPPSSGTTGPAPIGPTPVDPAPIKPPVVISPVVPTQPPTTNPAPTTDILNQLNQLSQQNAQIIAEQKSQATQMSQFRSELSGLEKALQTFFSNFSKLFPH